MNPCTPEFLDQIGWEVLPYYRSSFAIGPIKDRADAMSDEDVARLLDLAGQNAMSVLLFLTDGQRSSEPRQFGLGFVD